MDKEKFIYAIAKEAFGEDVFLGYQNDFSNRLIIQKYFYMLQEISKIKLFNFSWYIAGPYSPELTNIIYTQMLEQHCGDWDKKVKLTVKGISLANKIKEVFDFDFKTVKLKKHEWFELIASIHYIKSKNKNYNKSNTLSRIIKLKPQYTKEKVSPAVDYYFKNINNMVKE
jgi:uncharacterized protein YwgA